MSLNTFIPNEGWEYKPVAKAKDILLVYVVNFSFLLQMVCRQKAELMHKKYLEKIYGGIICFHFRDVWIDEERRASHSSKSNMTASTAFTSARQLFKMLLWNNSTYNWICSANNAHIHPYESYISGCGGASLIVMLLHASSFNCHTAPSSQVPLCMRNYC